MKRKELIDDCSKIFKCTYFQMEEQIIFFFCFHLSCLRQREPLNIRVWGNSVFYVGNRRRVVPVVFTVLRGTVRNHLANPTGFPSAKRYNVESYPCSTAASSTPDRWEYIIIRAQGEARCCFAPFALSRVALHRNSMQIRSQTSPSALDFDEISE